ncbi:MAG: hypothetical protein ACT4QG_10855 [Sporichthyaceae bacterium]
MSPRHLLEVDPVRFEKALATGGADTALALFPAELCQPVGAAVRDPLLRVTARIAESDGGVEHRLWVAEECAVLLLDAGEGRRELVTVAPALWTAALAGVLDLGPRRGHPAAAPLAVPTAAIEDLLGEEPTAFARAVKQFDPSGWRLIALLADGAAETEGGATLLLYDTGEAWLLAGSVRDDDTIFEPSSASQIWRILQRIQPSPKEQA